MTTEEKRYIIQYSLEDVIDVLQGAPIQRDMVAQITVVQVMNRIPASTPVHRKSHEVPDYGGRGPVR